MLQENFLYNFNLFYTDFIFVLQGSQLRRVLKKKNPKRILFISFDKLLNSVAFNKCIYKDLIMATLPCKSNKRRSKKQTK